MSIALGFIETNSLIGAVEAANKMVQHSKVDLVEKEILSPGLVTLIIAGKSADVETALKTGMESLRKSGKMASDHILSEPNEKLVSILPGLGKYLNFVRKTSEQKEDSKATDIDSEKDYKRKSENKKEIKDEKKDMQISGEVISENKQPEIKEVKLSYRNPTLERLRREALGITENVTAKNNSLLTEEISSDYNSLNVHQLRRLARSKNNFPIQGREISKAKRGELLDYFQQIEPNKYL